MKTSQLHTQRGSASRNERLEPTRRRGGLQLAALLIFAGWSNELHAQAVSQFTSYQNYAAYISDMPDLDQRRWNNDWPEYYGDGRMFCGPTAGANIVNYLGLQGESGLPSYASLNLGRYTSSTMPESTVEFINDFRLEASSRLIEEMALAMDTAPEPGSYAAVVWTAAGRKPSGTPTEDLEAGMAEILPSDYGVWGEGTMHCADGRNDSLRPREIFDELEAGNFVVIGVSPYNYNSDEDRYDRATGHIVTVTGVHRYEDEYGLWYVDSASEYGCTPGDCYDQSTYKYEYTTLSRVDDVVLHNVEDSGEESTCTRTRWALDDWSDTEGRLDLTSYMMVIEPPAE